MKHHKKFKLADCIEFPEPVTGVMMVKKNKLCIMTGRKVYIYKGVDKKETSLYEVKKK